MSQTDLFGADARLPAAFESFLRDANPWWSGRPGPILPSFRRWAFSTVLRKLTYGATPAVLVRGPRQVGKTTLQQQVIRHLIVESGVSPEHILRVQFDEIPSLKEISDPVLAIVRWYERFVLKGTLNGEAQEGRPVYVFLDEVQNLEHWSQQLKALVDHHTVRVLVTGSSALRLELGRESLAGRVSQIDLGTLLLREIASLRFSSSWDAPLGDAGLQPLLSQEFWMDLQRRGVERQIERDPAFAAFSSRGGYPVAQVRADLPWAEIADLLNDVVVRRVIQHDLRLGEKGRKRDARLLEEVFLLSCRYAGQAPGQAIFVSEVHQSLHADVGWSRILTYLRFLDGALLMRLIPPLEIRVKRQRGNHKLSICDHTIRASWLQETIPLDPAEIERNPHLADLAGHIAESVVGYFLGGIPHLGLAHFPERRAEPEIDFVLTVGEKRIPLEVKYRQRIDPLRDTVGLRSFLEKAHYNAPFGILVTMRDDVSIADPRIICISLPSLLMLR